LGVPKKIAPTAMSAIEEAGQSGKLLVSAISVWDIALLESRQRIVLPLPVNDWFAPAISRPEIKLVGLRQGRTRESPGCLKAVNSPYQENKRLP
jgi:PIN domain nuclease of toxin-antitoxin system